MLEITIGGLVVLMLSGLWLRNVTKKPENDYDNFRNRKIGKDCYIHGVTLHTKYSHQYFISVNFRIPIRFETEEKISKKDYENLVSILKDNCYSTTVLENFAEDFLPYFEPKVTKMWYLNPLKFDDASKIDPLNSMKIKDSVVEGFKINRNIYTSKDSKELEQSLSSPKVFSKIAEDSEEYVMYELTKEQAELLERIESMKSKGFIPEVVYCESELVLQDLKAFEKFVCEECDYKNDGKESFFFRLHRDELWSYSTFLDNQELISPLVYGNKEFSEKKIKLFEVINKLQDEEKFGHVTEETCSALEEILSEIFVTEVIVDCDEGVETLHDKQQEILKVLDDVDVAEYWDIEGEKKLSKALSEYFGNKLEVVSELSGESLSDVEKQALTDMRACHKLIPEGRVRWVFMPELKNNKINFEKLDKELYGIFMKKFFQHSGPMKVYGFSESHVNLEVLCGDKNIAFGIPKGSMKLSDLMKWMENETPLNLDMEIELSLSENSKSEPEETKSIFEPKKQVKLKD